MEPARMTRSDGDEVEVDQRTNSTRVRRNDDDISTSADKIKNDEKDYNYMYRFFGDAHNISTNGVGKYDQ
jgi:hypothetical protein